MLFFAFEINLVTCSFGNLLKIPTKDFFVLADFFPFFVGFFFFIGNFGKIGLNILLNFFFHDRYQTYKREPGVGKG